MFLSTKINFPQTLFLLHLHSALFLSSSSVFGYVKSSSFLMDFLLTDFLFTIRGCSQSLKAQLNVDGSSYILNSLAEFLHSFKINCQRKRKKIHKGFCYHVCMVYLYHRILKISHISTTHNCMHCCRHARAGV